ncbi:hypothetical protein EGW08_008612, partial [Elysia chlorotica]
RVTPRLSTSCLESAARDGAAAPVIPFTPNDHTMFESLSSKGPKLVYTHTRQGTPDRKVGETTASTPMSTGPASPSLQEPRVIPRPSVTVVAQTRKPLSEEHPQNTPWEQGAPTSFTDSPGKTFQSRTSATSGMVFTDQPLKPNGVYKNSESNRGSVYENYNPAQGGVNGHVYRLDTESSAAPANNITRSNGISINIERVGDLASTKHTDSSRTEESSSSSTVLPDSFNNSSGYHGGYRVYRGKVYEITREIPIILPDSNGNARLSPSPATGITVSSSNSKPAHISTATASIIKSSPATNGTVSSTHAPPTDLSMQVPKALPAPKLNGKTSNGVIQVNNSPSSPDYDSPMTYEQLSPHQQQSFYREHRRPLDESRVSDGPELLTYIGGGQSSRRP